jgi:6-phosphogluconolactonase
VPGDPVLNVYDHDVAVAGPCQGRRRLTLTYPAINRARQVLWVVTGAEKAPMLHRLLHCDADIPAGRVRREKSLVLADAAASGSPIAVRKRGA